MTIGRFACEIEGKPFLRGDDLLRAIGFFERVELGFPHVHRVGCRRSPFVVSEALVLAEVFVPRFADDQRSSSGLLRDSIVVARVLERLAVLDPPVPVGQ